MAEEASKKAWGGARSGSGRKKTTTKSIALRIPQDVEQILEQVPKRSEFIVEAIRELAARRGIGSGLQE